MRPPEPLFFLCWPLQRRPFSAPGVGPKQNSPKVSQSVILFPPLAPVADSRLESDPRPVYPQEKKKGGGSIVGGLKEVTHDPLASLGSSCRPSRPRRILLIKVVKNYIPATSLFSCQWGAAIMACPRGKTARAYIREESGHVIAKHSQERGLPSAVLRGTRRLQCCSTLQEMNHDRSTIYRNRGTSLREGIR